MSLIEQIDAGAYAQWIRNSDVLYPLLQVVHLIGISIVVGSLIVGNVRLLGAAPGLSIHDFSRHLHRWVLVGLVLFLVTGVHMAVGFLTIFAINPVMWIKLVLLIVAVVVNVRLYRWQLAAASAPAQAGAREKALAALSVLLLLSIIVMGKLLAYIGGKD
ncbi:MAG: DUF6644 family protein [Hydrogenophaga sp.]|uniref:DUF6644 family protein n=1 Tax=Hydrogenophaga sp. TaxID=1904254 RepID=UPI00277A2330|nr:DUF6644 family protein [Hydrogenophaga sp.]MDP2419361.1 hypothetical protein [Hydrogenophaga sp.]MDZ4174819.1 DUF6644 family protein [Hydrogenophaga sp.]